MLIPCATANPLNSFLNSGLTLKLSDVPLSGSVWFPSSGALIRLLGTRYPLTRRTDSVRSPWARPEFLISGFLASRKDRNAERRGFECALSSGRWLAVPEYRPIGRRMRGAVVRDFSRLFAWSLGRPSSRFQGGLSIRTALRQGRSDAKWRILPAINGEMGGQDATARQGGAADRRGGCDQGRVEGLRWRICWYERARR